jgi:hypothetical protein
MVNPGYKDSLLVTFDNYTNLIFFTDQLSGWTVSYAPYTEGFVSFHSFIPEDYLIMPNNYGTIKKTTDNKTRIWKHNKKYEYQNYYGITHRFDVGFVEVQQEDTELQSCSIVTDFFKVDDYKKFAYSKKFFDEIFVYNNNGSTGILPILLRNKDEARQSVSQNGEGQAEVSRVKGNTFNFNKLENNQLPNTPAIEFTGMDYLALNLTKKPPTQRENIKGKWHVIHLRATQNDKIVLHLNEALNDPIYKQ